MIIFKANNELNEWMKHEDFVNLLIKVNFIKSELDMRKTK